MRIVVTGASGRIGEWVVRAPGERGDEVVEVVEACRRLGIRKVVIASSVNAVGLAFNKGMPRLDYLPLDEAHPARPEDAYSLSKLVGEEVADAASRLEPAMSIASLRFHGVVFPERYRYPLYPDAAAGARSLWGYVDIRDAVAACLKALDASFTGHEVFFICASDTGIAMPTPELLERYFPGVPLPTSPAFRCAAPSDSMRGFSISARLPDCSAGRPSIPGGQPVKSFTYAFDEPGVIADGTEAFGLVFSML